MPAHADPVLHEFVPEASTEEVEMLVAGGEDGEPAALVYDGEVLPSPDSGAARSDQDALQAEPSGASSPSFRPDRLTELEERLGYQAAFSPSIAPFKRVTALDAVQLDEDGATPVLGVAPQRARALRVEGAEVTPPDGRPRDRFWGEVVLDFERGRRVPLPSVSPESRILTVRTEPETTLRFEKRGGDAFFAVAVGPLPKEPVRLVFLTDAPRTYFGASIPEVAADTLAHDVAPMPEEARAKALEFAAELGLAPDAPLPQVLRTLAGHFRSFEESAVPPPDQGDIYLDLARSKKGVCRHRTYAFVITAQALGVPSRFVYNEAHAWAEVKAPEIGWMRVDLGGAAQGLDARGAEDRPVHRPREPDPLPRPESYERSYSQLAGDVDGLRRDAAPEEGPPDASGTDATGGEDARTDADDGAAGRSGDGPTARESSSETEARSRSAPSGRPSRAEAGDSPDHEALTPLRVAIEKRHFEAYRGRALEVAGRVTDDRGRGVPGLRIEVLLQRRGERLLGVTVTREHGWFQGSFGVPPQLPVGDYQLVVRTPGDDAHAPASAR
ncbi:MAG: transglutaminase domain-containing protein [Myxococcota bacterium]